MSFMRSHLGVSLALHGALIAAAFLVLARRAPPLRFGSVGPAPLRVELMPRSSRPAGGTARARRFVPRAQGRRRAKGLPLSALGIALGSPGPEPAPSARPAFDSLNDAARPFYRALFERIQGALQYPSEVVEAGITGEVRLEFSVDPEGRLQGSFETVSADDRVLKVLVFQTLRRALATPLPVACREGCELRHGQARIEARFRFAIVGQGYAGEFDPAGAPGPRLEFRRYAVDPRREETFVQGPGVDGAIHRSDDPSAAVVRKWHIDRAGIFSAESNSRNQTVGIGLDPVKLFQWAFGKHKAPPALERYRDDPDY